MCNKYNPGMRAFVLNGTVGFAIPSSFQRAAMYETMSHLHVSSSQAPLMITSLRTIQKIELLIRRRMCADCGSGWREGAAAQAGHEDHGAAGLSVLDVLGGH